MFRYKADEQLSVEIIRRVIRKHQQTDVPRLKKLKDYYMNKADILRRVQDDESKPNNKIAHPYAKFITDTFTGYFMGEPVTYQSNENIEAYKSILDYNDEVHENVQLAKAASIYGVAWEICYIDNDGMIRFTAIDTKEIIPIYDETVENRLNYVIRYYQVQEITSDNPFTIVEVYDNHNMTKYKTSAELGNFELIEQKPHGFSWVPFVEYKNNDDYIGDYEEVISLIDAYNALVSDSINDFDYFCDAYLALYGYTADADDVAAMKKNRVLLMDEGTNAEFLTKSSDGVTVDNSKVRLEADIHKFACVPNPSDKNFGGNASGVAMKYKLLGTENIASIKEQCFRQGLMARAELIEYVMKLMRTGSFDFRGIEITFTRNIPINEDDITSMVKNLNGVVSKETLLAQLPFISDAKDEVKRLQAEQRNSVYLAGFTDYDAPKDETKEEVND